MSDADTLRVLNRTLERLNEAEAALFAASWERMCLLACTDRIADKINSDNNKEPDALLQTAICVSFMQGARDGASPVTPAEIEYARDAAAALRKMFGP